MTKKNDNKYGFLSYLRYLEKQKRAFDHDDLDILYGNIRRDIKVLKRYIEDPHTSPKAADRETENLITAMCRTLGYDPYAKYQDDARIKISDQEFFYGRQLMQFFVRSMFEHEIALAPSDPNNKKQINDLVYRKFTESLHSGRPINLEEAETENPIWVKRIMNAYAMWDQRSKEKFCMNERLAADDNLIPLGNKADVRRAKVWEELKKHNFLLRPLAELKYFASYTFTQPSTVDRLFDTESLTTRPLASIFIYQDIEGGFAGAYADAEKWGEELTGRRHMRGNQSEYPTYVPQVQTVAPAPVVNTPVARISLASVPPVVDSSADSAQEVASVSQDTSNPNKPTGQGDGDGQGAGGQGDE